MLSKLYLSGIEKRGKWHNGNIVIHSKLYLSGIENSLIVDDGTQVIPPNCTLVELKSTQV